MVKDSYTNQEQRQMQYSLFKSMAKTKTVAAPGSVELKGQMEEYPGISKDLYGCLSERMGVPY